MQLICKTLLPPRMSVTFIFWTLSSYTLQSIVIVTTAVFIPVSLFIARQSRDRMSGLTSCQAVNQQTSQIRLCNAPNFYRLYLRHFWTDLLPVFSIIICSSQATKLSTTSSIWKFQTLNIKYAQNQSITFIFSTTVWNFVTRFSQKHFYILSAAACKARTKSTVWKLNRKP